MNTKQLLEDESSREFIKILGDCILGESILDSNNSEQKIVYCVQVFQTYILNYIENKHGKKAVLQLKNTTTTNNLFEKFENLGEYYNQAYQAFFSDLQQYWQS